MSEELRRAEKENEKNFLTILAKYRITREDAKQIAKAVNIYEKNRLEIKDAKRVERFIQESGRMIS